MIDFEKQNEELKSKISDLKMRGGIVTAMFVLSFLTVLVVFIEHRSLKEEHAKCEKKSVSFSVDPQKILDTLHNYYLVNIQDLKLIKKLKITEDSVKPLTFK